MKWSSTFRARSALVDEIVRKYGCQSNVGGLSIQLADSDTDNYVISRNL